MKCDKCGEVFMNTPGHEGVCPRCFYFDESNSDFRAFRRQVLLSLMSSDTSTTFMATEDYIKTAWDFADRIARAEPKE